MTMTHESRPGVQKVKILMGRIDAGTPCIYPVIPRTKVERAEFAPSPVVLSQHRPDAGADKPAAVGGSSDVHKCCHVQHRSHNGANCTGTAQQSHN